METVIQEKVPSLPSTIRKQVKYNKTTVFTSEDSWDVYGDTLKHYEEDFAPVLNGETIFKFIEQRHSPIILDIMAPSATLRDFFKKIPDKPKLGIAISLLDKRKADEKSEDEKLGIKQLSGNIMFGSFWRKLKNELGGKKADLIMERAVGGLLCLPKNEDLYLTLLNKAWSLLSEDNGMLLFQVPSYVDLKQNFVRVEEWVNLLKENNLNVVYKNNKHNDTDRDSTIDRGVLKIIKTPSSPKELPFLK